MTWKISIELDCPHHHAELIFEALTEWAHTGDPTQLHHRWLDLWMKRLSPAVSLGPHQTDTEVMQALGATRKWVCWEGFPYETCSPDNPRGCQFPEDCGWHWTIKADDQ